MMIITTRNDCGGQPQCARQQKLTDANPANVREVHGAVKGFLEEIAESIPRTQQSFKVLCEAHFFTYLRTMACMTFTASSLERYRGITAEFEREDRRGVGKKCVGVMQEFRHLARTGLLKKPAKENVDFVRAYALDKVSKATGKPIKELVEARRELHRRGKKIVFASSLKQFAMSEH